MRKLSSSIGEIIKPLLKGKNPAEVKILTEWLAIVGDEFAKYTSPKALKTMPNGETSITILHLTVYGSASLLIQHSEPEILERISRYFGYRLVERIKLHNEPIHIEEPKQPKKIDQAATPSSLDDIDDPELKSALKALWQGLQRNES